MRRCVVLLLATAALSGAACPAAAAVGDPVTGYWTRTNPGPPVPVLPVSPVPEGGTWVAADPTGPLAVSALRTELPAGRVGVELRLPIGDAVGTVNVQACPTLDRWPPEQGGRLEGAPTGDCATPLPARVAGEVLVVPLPPGLGSINVLLRPAPGSAFSLTLERATAAAVVTATAPVPPGAVSPPVPPPAPAPAAEEDMTTAPPPGFPALVAPPAPAGPLLPSGGIPAPAPVAATPAPAPGIAPLPVAALTNPAALQPSDRPAALLGLAVLALLGLQSLRLARQTPIAPRALGGAARRSGRDVGTTDGSVTAVRGLGRFQRDRSRPPVRL